jgi:hypothetical protein
MESNVILHPGRSWKSAFLNPEEEIQGLTDLPQG